MFSVKVDPINLDRFSKNLGRFREALQVEMKVALVGTREDFLIRVDDILGSVSEYGGSLGSPYVMVYKRLSISWVSQKRRMGLKLPIGTATGETKAWLKNFANNPVSVIEQGKFLEIDAGVEDSGDATTPEGKIYAMEFGREKTGQPERPIFLPVVAWYISQGSDTPFYHHMVAARNRAIERVYGS